MRHALRFEKLYYLDNTAPSVLTIGAYILTDGNNASIVTDSTMTFSVALLHLFQKGKRDRSLVEQELRHLSELEQEYWLPVLDHPELFVKKLKEIVGLFIDL